MLRPFCAGLIEPSMATKKVALVTGANKGLGFEIAKQLSEQGVKVLLAGRDLGKAERAAQTLRAKGADIEAVKLDVTNPADIARVAGEIKQLDILVNNAGVASGSGEDVSVDQLRTTFETNVFAPFALTNALLPLLKESPAGRIVNQSSILGSLTTLSSGEISGAWLNPAYCASKTALNMLTVVLAQQLKGTNVKVNAAHPGWVKTDMGGSDAPLELPEGAKTAVALALLPSDGPTGAYMHLGNVLPW